MCFYRYKLLLDMLMVIIHSSHTTLFDVTEKDDTGVHVEDIVDKECLTKEVDMSVKGATPAENCDISQKKDQETHTVDVSNEFDT